MLAYVRLDAVNCSATSQTMTSIRTYILYVSNTVSAVQDKRITAHGPTSKCERVQEHSIQDQVGLNMLYTIIDAKLPEECSNVMDLLWGEKELDPK